MKKLFIMIITVTMFAGMFTAYASSTTTPEGVEQLILRTGLGEYSDLYNAAVIDRVENTIMNKSVKDIIDIDYSFRIYGYSKTSNGNYAIDTASDDLIFRGISPDGFLINVSYIDGNFWYDSDPFELKSWNEVKSDFRYDLKKISDIINNGNVGQIKEIYYLTSAIYIKTDNNEYAIPLSDKLDSHAEYLGKTPRNIKQGELMTFQEWANISDIIDLNAAQDNRSFAELIGGNINQTQNISGDIVRDTDTLTPYIGKTSIFPDVDSEKSAYVNELYNLEIISGFDDGTFKPSACITRAQVASIIARLFKCDTEFSPVFSDVYENDWFSNSVTALAKAGIINGKSEGIFAPYETMTYEELFKIIVYALGYSDKNVNYPAGTTKKAIELGLTKGFDNINTAVPITRIDAAVVLSNALDTHLFTYNISVDAEIGNITEFNEDITLIDYISGKKLNGYLVTATQIY